MNPASFPPMRRTPAKAVFGVARTGLQIQHVINRLKSCGFDRDRLSFLFRHTEDGAIAPDSLHRGAGGRMAARSAPDWEEWMYGLEFFALPGLGLLLISGPLLMALYEAKAGGIGYVLRTMGICESVADRYTEEVRIGNILVSFHSGDPLEAKIVRMVFTGAGANNVAMNGETIPTELWPAAPRHGLS